MDSSSENTGEIKTRTEKQERAIRRVFGRSMVLVVLSICSRLLSFLFIGFPPPPVQGVVFQVLYFMPAALMPIVFVLGITAAVKVKKSRGKVRTYPLLIAVIVVGALGGLWCLLEAFMWFIAF